MKRAKRKTYFAGIGVAALCGLSLVPAQAMAATTGSSPVLMVKMQVVATGLNVPRGVVYDPSHQRLLIAEAGVAAKDTGPCSPAGANGTVCYGASGSVYSWVLPGASGKSRRIITGLPSLSDPHADYVKGLEDISLFHGQLTGAFSLSGDLATRTGLGRGAANLGRAVVFGQNGKVTPVIDVAAEEAKLYGKQALADAWGVTTGDFGTLVANGVGVPAKGHRYGGNDILQLRRGKLTEMLAFPKRASGGKPNFLIRSAPDTVVQGPDGAFYIGELTSYPYPNGAARVWRVVPGHRPTVFASGFTKVIDIAFDPSGRMLVLEDGHFGQNGTLVRINKDGTKTVIASKGLVNPMAVLAVSDNTYYVTNDQGGIGHDGQLLKITLSSC